MDIQEKINSLSIGIAKFLQEWIEDKQGIDSRNFYGDSFSLALLNIHGKLDKKVRDILFNEIESKDKSDPEYHWEFNNYALLDYFQTTGDEQTKKLISPLRFKHTPCTNWTLLRNCCRLKAQENENLAIEEARGILRLNQKRSGLILDEPRVKSFQYHCFSAAMALEIFYLTKESFFKDCFLKAVGFIRNFIQESGETLYIGRGQNQSFGYGALLYILSAAFAMGKDPNLLSQISKVLTFLENFESSDGSFPLMLNHIEPRHPLVPQATHPDFAGWYPYNNYFDYLPFLGYFLKKSADCMNLETQPEQKETCILPYRDRDFIKIITKEYQSVLSKPGGYWTNDAPFPIIFRDNKRLTPCYGGEQFQKSIYTPKGIPLPYCEALKKSIRWKSLSFFKKNTLWVISPLGIMHRHFLFLKNRIEIKTTVYSIFAFHHLYLFHKGIQQTSQQKLKSNSFTIISSSSLEKSDTQYSADGALDSFVARKKSHKLILEIR